MRKCDWLSWINFLGLETKFSYRRGFARAAFALGPLTEDVRKDRILELWNLQLQLRNCASEGGMESTAKVLSLDAYREKRGQSKNIDRAMTGTLPNFFACIFVFWVPAVVLLPNWHQASMP
jgi:hypothetical protein